MHAKVLLLVVGLVVGGLAGWFTRPAGTEIEIGSVNVEIDGRAPANARGGSLTSAQTQHLIMLIVIGGLVGLVLGFVVDRGRR